MKILFTSYLPIFLGFVAKFFANWEVAIRFCISLDISSTSGPFYIEIELLNIEISE